MFVAVLTYATLAYEHRLRSTYGYEPLVHNLVRPVASNLFRSADYGPLNSEGAFQESGQPLAAISCPNVLSLCAGAFNDIATSHFDENCATQ